MTRRPSWTWQRPPLTTPAASTRRSAGLELAQAEAQVNFIKVQISNSTITSPISGIVTNRNINPGEITSTTSPLMSVADVATLKLQGNVSQEDVVRICPWAAR